MSTVRELRIEQYVEYPLIKIEGMNLKFLLENLLTLLTYLQPVLILWPTFG